MKKKKILHIVDGLHPKRGGVPTAVLNISELLDDIQITYDILSIGDNPAEKKENRIYFNTKNKFSFSGQGLRWFLRNYKNYDIIYFHAVWNLNLLLILSTVLRKKRQYFISAHGSLDRFDIKKKFFLKKILGALFIHRALARAECIFCTSEKEKEQLYFFGKKADNLRVLPLPVNYFRISQKTGSGLQAKDVFDAPFTFLFLSRINYKKGIKELITSISEIVKSNPGQRNFKLIIAGDDRNEYAEKIKEEVESMGIGKYVEFVGLLTGESKLQAFASADVFVLPSQNENFGLSIIEALQTGTPVLISKNVYIYPELFDRGLEPGWLCESDLNDLKQKIVEALTSVEMKKKKEQSIEAGNLYRNENLKLIYSQYFV